MISVPLPDGPRAVPSMFFLTLSANARLMIDRAKPSKRRMPAIIFCMEKSHLNRLQGKFPEALRDKRVICLHIPDEFEFMDPELLDEFRAKLAPHITLPAKDGLPSSDDA